MIVQARPSLQDRLEGQMKDRERRVTHLIASEEQEAFCVDNGIICYKKSEHSFTLERGDQSSERARRTRTCSRKLRNFRKGLHEQEVKQEQGLESTRMFEAQLRPQLHPEEQKEASIVNGGSLKETFESKRQAGKTR